MIRQLIHIPVVHTEADMGALGGKINKMGIEKMGQAAWTQRAETIEQSWQKIRQELEDMNLSYDHVRLYQDGLPVGNFVHNIVEDLAKAGSLNHQLLLHLIQKGATLMGTESPELLVEEYSLAQNVFRARSPQERATCLAQQRSLSAEVLQKRNRFIAKRIDDTLLQNEMGILFLGLLHSLEGLLAEDIEVKHLVCLPLFESGRVET